MKKFAILLSVALILLVVIVVYDNADLSNDEPTLSATEAATIPTGRECVEHSSEAVVSQWAACAICEAKEGKSFGAHCETWEDVVSLAGFDKYSYELAVTEYDNWVSLDLTFDYAEQFTDDKWVCDFMCDSYLAFVGISWFTWNQSSVETPDKFQKFAVIMLEFPGGSVVCTTQASYSPIGISTRLFVDEESLNKFRIERIYNLFFKSVD